MKEFSTGLIRSGLVCFFPAVPPQDECLRWGQPSPLLEVSVEHQLVYKG